MPFFGRSLLAKGAEAVAGGLSYFQNSGTTSDGSNGASLVLDRGSGNVWDSNTKKITASFWFKGNSSSLPTDGTVKVFRTFVSESSGISVDIRTTGIETVIQDENNNFILQAFPANFSTNYLNNAWHHCVVEFGAVSGSTSGRCFLDGIDKETSDTTNTGVSFTNNRFAYVNGQPTETPTSAIYYDSNVSTLQFSEIFVDFSKDYNIASNIANFYSSGYVNMGTDGTASGLAKPDIFLTISGGSIVNNGTVSCSVIEVYEGTGAWTKSTTGGPGA